MKITIVAGARPNFMKIAPIIRAIQKKEGISFRLIHTGQHYDEKLSGSFFRDLEIPAPNNNLGVGAGSHAVQTANIMVQFEQELLSHPCDLILVVGDVNSTLACALVAKKMQIGVIHVEAGLRSGDMTMPEEINRLMVDAISDVLFTTTQEAAQTLVSEGRSADQIHFVGNVMIDSVCATRKKWTKPELREHPLDFSKFLILTLHRPSNVDDLSKLKNLLAALTLDKNDVPIIFPVHPRTKSQLTQLDVPKHIKLIDPLGYLEFMWAISHSKGVITDSGGIQEETTFLGIPCMTLRDNTERPETISIGTNELVGSDYNRIASGLASMINGSWKKGKIPDLWDGNAAIRIVEILGKINS